MPEGDRHAPLRDRGRHVAGGRADRARGPAVGRFAAQLVAGQVHVRALPAHDSHRLLAHAHEQAARVESLPQAPGSREQPHGSVLHAYSPSVLAMMFFWISEVPP